MSNLFTGIRKPGEAVTLDFGNRRHRDAFCALYGGEEKMKNSFPQFYEAFQRAAKLHKRGEGMNYATLHQLGSDEGEGFVDGIDISCVNYTIRDRSLYVEAVTSLVDTALFIDEHLEIQTTAGEPVCGFSQSTPDTYTSSIKVTTPFDPKEFQSTTLNIDYVVTWIDGEKNILKSQIYSKEEKQTCYLTDCVDSIDLKFPVTTQNQEVIICYGRQPLKGETVDRTYQQAIIGGVQKLYLDVQAEVKLKNGAKFVHIDPSSMVLKLNSRGMAQYTKTGRMDEIMKRFAATSDGFAFSLDSDWKDNVPTARLPVQDKVDIQMYAAFDLGDGTQGDFMISSTAYKTEGNVYKAQQLRLLWGCLAENSMICMADGSERQIQDIRIGDRVSLANGETGRVENVWSGTEEEPLICLETAGGRLCCTRLHPVMTDRGIVRAENITGADRLLCADGSAAALIGDYPLRIEKVYNLDIRNEATQKAEGSLLICNGFLVGDNLMQNCDLNTENKIKPDPRIARECELKNRFFGERN